MTGTQDRQGSRGLRTGLAFTALVLLGACGEGHFQMPAFASRAAGSPEAIAGSGTTAFVERDVEAPEVFQVTEAGLWDGRPSLGGIWVAHPDVSDPERVIIRNSDNGQFVIGALFRRERETPGPRLQVSSDAAEALGLLAGAPTQLNVTALRSEAQPAQTTAAPAMPSPETGDLQAPESVEITALQSTSAPLAPEPQTAPASPAAAPIPSAAPAASATPRVDPIASAAAALEAIGAATAATTATAAAIPAVEIPAAAAAPIIPASAPAAATAPLVTPAPAPAPVVAAAATTPATTPERAPVTPSPQGDLSKPYIQIGIFSVEENATTTAEAMRSAGITPIMLEGQSQGRRFWRVIVGPANSETERASMLQKVKAEGFPDAYAVTN